MIPRLNVLQQQQQPRIVTAISSLLDQSIAVPLEHPETIVSLVDNNNNNNQEEAVDEYNRTYSLNLQLAQFASDVTTTTTNRQRSLSKIGLAALELFDSIPMKDTVSYNTLFKVLAKVSPTILNGTSAAQWSDQLLTQMKAVHEIQLTANEAWYHRMSIMNLTDEEISQGPPRVRVKPNVRSYGTVMDAYSRVGTLDAANRCQELMKELNERYHNHNTCNGILDIALQPNIICYNTVLNAYAKAGGSVAATTCLQLLRNMPISPDRISYNAALHAIARSGWNDAGERAESMLKDEMIQFTTTEDDDCAASTSTVVSAVVSITPNARSYTTCMDAYGQCRQPEKAHELLRELQTMYEMTNDITLRPTLYSYATVLHSYAISNHPQKAKLAYQIYTDATNYVTTPNRVIYNSILNCFATSTTTTTTYHHHNNNNNNSTHQQQFQQQTRQEIMIWVQDLYHQQVQLYPKTNATHGPDHVTFGTVLKACCNLWIPRPRSQDDDDVSLSSSSSFPVQVFQEASRRGQVSSGVLWQFRQAVPIEVYRTVLGGDDSTIRWHTLPNEWICNVHDEQQRGSGGGTHNIRRHATTSSTTTTTAATSSSMSTMNHKPRRL